MNIRLSSFLLSALMVIPLSSKADCWLVANLHGYGALSGDNYSFGKDAVTDGVFKVYISNGKAGIYNVSQNYAPDMRYTAVSDNSIVGVYQAGGGITIETWSITTDKKAIYSKVMNTPGIQRLTSTKSFVGDVVGNCSE